MKDIYILRHKGLPRVLGFSPENIMEKVHSNPKFLGANIWRKAIDDSGFYGITDIYKLMDFDFNNMPEIIEYNPLNKAEIDMYLDKFSTDKYRTDDLRFYTKQERLFEQAAIQLNYMKYMPKEEWGDFLKKYPNKIISSSFRF